MKQITAYETSDGLIFKEKQSAELHENKKEFENKIKSLAMFFEDQDFFRSNVDVEELEKFLATNLKTLKEKFSEIKSDYNN